MNNLHVAIMLHPGNRPYKTTPLCRNFFASIFILIFLVQSANTQNFVLEEFGTKQGLASAEIYTLFQDNIGYLWLGTRIGVSRFDGNQFTNYNGSKQIRFGKVFGITQDSENDIWIGAENGLFYYHADSITQVPLNKDFPDPWIYTVYFAKDLSLWIGTSSGPVKIDEAQLETLKSGSSLKYNLYSNWKNYSFDNNQVCKIKEDEKGNVFFGTRSALLKLKSGIFSEVWKIKDLNLVDVSDFEIADDDTIFITTRLGSFYRVSPNSNDSISELPFSGGIEYVSDSNYLVLSIEKLYTLNNGKQKMVYDFSAYGYDYLSCLLIDNENNIWVSSWEGLIKLRSNIFTTWLPEKTENLNDIFSIIQAPDGKMLLGGNKGNIITPTTNGFSKYLPNNIKPWKNAEVFGMYFNTDGALWLGSGYEGISMFKNNVMTTFDENTLGDSHGQDFYRDNNGKLFCMAEGKLCEILNPEDNNRIEFKDYKWHVYVGGKYLKLFDHVVMPNNDTYFATNFGLVYFDGDTLIKVEVNDIDLSTAIITSLISNIDNTLWVATGNFGIYHIKINRGSATILQHIDRESGLLSDAVLDLLKDNTNKIWVAHYNGISILQESNAWEIIKRLDESDGFLPYDFTYIKLAQDRITGAIWLATTSGVQKFDPTLVPFNKTYASAVLTHVLLFNSAVSMSKYALKKNNINGIYFSPNLPYNMNSITFKFQSVSLTEPTKNRCRYRLMGFDSTWVYTNAIDEVTFASLAPGNYIFELQAANNDGIWSKKTETYPLHINAPFWESWWFILLTISCISSMIYLAYKYRINQLVKINTIRNKIAGDLHDDIGSTLSSIRMYSDIVSSQLKENNPESIPLLKKMSDNSEEMIENMSDIVWAIKPANDAFKNIESRMFNFATELCRAKNIQLYMQRNEALEGIKIPMQQRRDLYLIFKEAINNAVKYSHCSELKVHFSKSSNLFMMSIIDNGKGFNPADSKTGNGLENMKKRASEHKGKLEIITSLGNGTRLMLSMPVG